MYTQGERELPLPEHLRQRRKKREQQRGRLVILGPLPWAWLAHASNLASRPLRLALLLYLLRGLQSSNTVKIEYQRADDLGMSRHAVYRELAALEAAGLVTVERKPGCSPLVTIKSSNPKDTSVEIPSRSLINEADRPSADTPERS